MAGRSKGTLGRRKLWRRHRERMDVELWDYGAKNKLCEGLDSPYGPLTDKDRVALQVHLEDRGRTWRLPELLLKGVEPRVEHRIKETESGTWWKILDVTESSTDHFRDCRCVLLEVDT